MEWNLINLNEFKRLARLSEIEEAVLDARVDGQSRVQVSQAMNVSVATVDRVIKRLKAKYDAVERYSYILQPRK